MEENHSGQTQNGCFFSSAHGDQKAGGGSLPGQTMQCVLGLKCKVVFPVQAPLAGADKDFSQGMEKRWVKPHGLNPAWCQLRCPCAGWELTLAAPLHVNWGFTHLIPEDIIGLEVRVAGLPMDSACKAKFRGLWELIGHTANLPSFVSGTQKLNLFRK